MYSCAIIFLYKFKILIISVLIMISLLKSRFGVHHITCRYKIHSELSRKLECTQSHADSYVQDTEYSEILMSLRTFPCTDCHNFAL